MLGTPTDKRGCAIVDSHLNPPGHSNIFVCGDLAHVEEDGRQIPGVAQPAMQEGKYVGKVIKARLAGHEPPGPFQYFDKGSMAPIGHRRAVAESMGLRFTGMPAYLMWGFIHV